jgi:murein L,D-transpeptidase YafK
MVVAALAVALALAGCEIDGSDLSARALKPLSQTMLADLERKHMPKESPILVRLFKEQSELEVWKQDDSGRFALLATYPICRWSGELGPKVQQGDRQAPEGFYTITPEQFNPHSQYYLSFDLGYPNTFDRAYGRTGSSVMVHGACASAGCYAMTDEQISEIYALARESFFGGQRSFQVQAYPFRMTPINMAKHRDNQNMPFWKMLKEGNDHFEVTRLEPKVDVCEKRYMFDAKLPANATMRQVSFNPTGNCPAYQVGREIASAVAKKQRADSLETAELIRHGTPSVPSQTGIDGGMHPVFVGKFGAPFVRDGDDAVRTVVEARPAAPGASTESGSLFSRLFGSSEEKKPEPTTKSATPKLEPARIAKIAAAKPDSNLKPLPELHASPSTRQEASAEQQKVATSAETADLMAGAQPVVPAGRFESRWSAMH